MRWHQHPRREGASRPLGRLHGGDLRFKCERCDRPIMPSDIVVAEFAEGDIITIDCACGERSEIWMTPYYDYRRAT
jgi:hypothetical protein